MLNLPSSTEFGRRVPKQKFYEHLDVSPEVKRLFIDQIKLITWSNKLSPQTMNLGAGQTVTEIEVFHIRLTGQELDKRTLELMDRQIPYHILFVLERPDGQMQLRISYKEAAQSGDNAFRLRQSYATEFAPPESLTLPLDALDMDSLYASIVRAIAGDALAAPEQPLEQAVAQAQEKEKQEIIRENSKAVVLNRDVLEADIWDIPQIQARAKRLANIVANRYAIDRITDDSIEFEYVETITLDHYDEVTGKKLVSFKLFGKTYRQNKYALMLLDVIKLLDKKKPGKLQELANRHYSFNSTKRKHVHLNTDGVGMRWPWKLSDTIYLEANLSAWSCIRFIDNLISEFGFDRSQFSFNIVSEESDESIENEE